jgi:hypothetical protein
MTTFGIISEGPSDQIVIENILVGYFNDQELPARIKYLQPLHDATDNDTRQHGGWKNVFEYCQSDYLIEALEQNDYLIVQIDTDCCEEKYYDVKRTKEGGDKLTHEELIFKIIEKFEALFATSHNDKYDLFKDRILFAISVEEIECWLLPLYHNDKTKASTNNCIHKLNPKLTEKFGRFIDKNDKSVALPYYDKFTRPFLNPKTIDSIYNDNISLKVFLDELGKVKLN